MSGPKETKTAERPTSAACVEVPSKVEVLDRKVDQGLYKRSAEDQRQLELRGMEDGLLQSASRVVEDAMHFNEITATSVHPPRKWIEELGEARAKQRLKVARAAWAPAKDAPVALTLAQRLLAGIIKARASEKGARSSLNVAVSVEIPMPDFQEIDID